MKNLPTVLPYLFLFSPAAAHQANHPWHVTTAYRYQGAADAALVAQERRYLAKTLSTKPMPAVGYSTQKPRPTFYPRLSMPRDLWIVIDLEVSTISDMNLSAPIQVFLFPRRVDARNYLRSHRETRRRAGGILGPHQRLSDPIHYWQNPDF